MHLKTSKQCTAIAHSTNERCQHKASFESELCYQHLKSRPELPYNGCERCRYHGDIHEHHIIPRCLGGNNEIENLVNLCSQCHREWHWFFEPLELANIHDVFKKWVITPPIVVWIKTLLDNPEASLRAVQELWTFFKETRDENAHRLR